MKNPRRAKLLLAFVLGLPAAGLAALVPTEWSRRQPVAVPAPGVMQLSLPPAAYDAAAPEIVDVRLVDATGREVPYLSDDTRVGGLRQPRPAFRPKSFRVVPDENLVHLVLETGTDEKLDSLLLETPAPFFLKAAHVEISPDGGNWQSLGPASPVFRKFGAELLRLELRGRAAAFVRVTLDNAPNRQVAFTGAELTAAAAQPARVPPVPVAVRITRREDFATETMLTVELEGRNLPLASLGLEAADPVFMRRVTVAVREADGAGAHERIVAAGTLYRVALEGAEARSQLELPVNFTPSTREILVHIHNGDSPPLALTRLTAQYYPTDLLFHAPAAGTYYLLTGNAQVDAPDYDLAAFLDELRRVRPTRLTAGAAEDMPGYHPREPLAVTALPEIPLAGAPLDTHDWVFHRALHLENPGIQELELDPAALAGAQGSYADLRVMHRGNQIPYVLERPPLHRAIALPFTAAPDPKRPSYSVWRVTLPQPRLPASHLTLTSATRLFTREFSILERAPKPQGGTMEFLRGIGKWSRWLEPRASDSQTFALDPPFTDTDTLWIETDNGDNPAIELGAVQATYPVIRLIFKAGEAGDYELAYGNDKVRAPSYDLNLVAGRLLSAPRQVARFATAAPAPAPAADGVAGLGRGVLFWTVLSLVVVGLLVAIARLLPKLPAGK